MRTLARSFDPPAPSGNTHAAPIDDEVQVRAMAPPERIGVGRSQRDLNRRSVKKLIVGSIALQGLVKGHDATHVVAVDRPERSGGRTVRELDIREPDRTAPVDELLARCDRGGGCSFADGPTMRRCDPGGARACASAPTVRCAPDKDQGSTKINDRRTSTV